MGVQANRTPGVRPAVATRYAVETGRAQGISVVECLAGTGLRGSDLEEPGATVRAGQELRVIRNLITHAGNGRERDGDTHRGGARELGVATGRRYTLTSAGIVGYAMLTSPTVRDAIRLLPRYFAVTSVRFEPVFEETADGLTVTLGDGERGSSVRDFLLARDLTAAREVVSALMSPLTPLSQPESDTVGGGFTVLPDVLDHPAHAPDTHTGLLCIQQCESALDRRHRHTGTAAQVRRILLRTPASPPAPAEVAHELGVSERALHNRLAAQHVSFRGLVDQLRQLLTAEFLDLGMTAQSVARMTGTTARTGPGYPRRPGRSAGGTHDIPR
ncbi:AraC family transcriptional regulator ligand-binding domain-containing protein [Nocardia sp. NPDC004722]